MGHSVGTDSRVLQKDNRFRAFLVAADSRRTDAAGAGLDLGTELGHAEIRPLLEGRKILAVTDHRGPAAAVAALHSIEEAEVPRSPVARTERVVVYRRKKDLVLHRRKMGRANRSRTVEEDIDRMGQTL